MPALFGRERSGFGGRVAVGGEGLGGGGGLRLGCNPLCFLGYLGFVSNKTTNFVSFS